MMLVLILPAAFIMDLIIGDPKNIPHPVTLIGRLISICEKFIRRFLPHNKISELISGAVLTLIISALAFLIPTLILAVAYHISIVIGVVIHIILCFQLLAIKSLKDAALKVFYPLKNNNIDITRKELSHIVGRDTANLDEKQIIKATVETLAENTSDGIVAVLFYVIIGGAPLGYLYKAVNTMDSMIGYKTVKYQYFGKTAARFDDLLNFIPSRITGLLYILSAMILKYDYKSAYKIFKRDRYNHSSPNSAQIESACAGALNIQLGGDSYYFGSIVHKKTIGDSTREVVNTDIMSTVKLMHITSVLALIIFVAIRFIAVNSF